MTNGASGTESISFLTYRQTIEQFQLGMGSALSVLLFLSVLLIAWLIVKLFRVDLAAARQEAERCCADWHRRRLPPDPGVVPVAGGLDHLPVVQDAGVDHRRQPRVPALRGNQRGLQNYIDVWDNEQFRRAILNSVGIALIATVASVILGTLAAYAIARLEFRGKKFVLTTALAIAMFPVVSLVGPLFDMWRTLGLYDTWPGLIIPT